MSSRSNGIAGEDDARAFLTNAGSERIESNYRGRFGEIDIIARDGEYTVFIEVKRRTGTRFGLPREAVTASKQKKIILTATEYAAKRGLLDSPLRFDVVEVLPGTVNVIKGAFTA